MASFPVASRGVLTVRPGGCSLSVPRGMPRGGGLRGVIRGWSVKSASRHVRWLQSVEPSALEGMFGLAVTLTVRDMPESARAWARARRVWIRFARECGAVLGHWVTEWQVRGVPHLHFALFFDDEPSLGVRSALVRRWCRVTARWGARPVGQDVHSLYYRDGWSRYQAKHSARSVRHAQRGGMPSGWDRSGRLWGHWGDWVTREDTFVLDGRTWSQLRRLVRSWALADARSESRRAVRVVRVQAVKRSLRGVSGLRGLREWIPERVLARMVAFLVQGGAIILGADDEAARLEAIRRDVLWWASTVGFERRLT